MERRETRRRRGRRNFNFLFSILLVFGIFVILEDQIIFFLELNILISLLVVPSVLFELEIVVALLFLLTSAESQLIGV